MSKREVNKKVGQYWRSGGNINNKKSMCILAIENNWDLWRTVGKTWIWVSKVEKDKLYNNLTSFDRKIWNNTNKESTEDVYPPSQEQLQLKLRHWECNRGH